MLCVSSSAICRRISFHQRFSNGRLLRLSYPICGSFLVWFGFVCLFFSPSFARTLSLTVVTLTSSPTLTRTHSLTFSNTHAIDYMYTISTKTNSPAHHFGYYNNHFVCGVFFSSHFSCFVFFLSLSIVDYMLYVHVLH